MEEFEKWWQTIGLNMSHHDACLAAFLLGQANAGEIPGPNEDED